MSESGGGSGEPSNVDIMDSLLEKLRAAAPQTRDQRDRRRRARSMDRHPVDVASGQKISGLKEIPDAQLGAGDLHSDSFPIAKERAIHQDPARYHVFGAQLADAAQCNTPIGGVSVPLPSVVFRCLEYLNHKNAVREHNIFRVGGSSIIIKQLRERFNTEGDIDLIADGQDYDIHEVAQLLKLYLKELPSTILTPALQNEFLFLEGTYIQDDEMRIAILGRLVRMLPLPNHTLLTYLLSFLVNVVSHEDVNKMDARNLGDIFAPALKIPEHIFNILLQHYDDIFGATIETDLDGASEFHDDFIGHIEPDLEGFRQHLSSVAPYMVAESPYLLDRVARQQVIRYNSLLRAKQNHIRIVEQDRGCPNMTLCIAQGGSSMPFGQKGKDKDTHNESDTDFPFADGHITQNSFPPGIPMPPVDRLPARLECQICYSAINFQKPSDWTKHVHEDVRPFTCTWQGCSDPKAFKRKADWVRHENERHRHLEWWKCDLADCSRTFYRRDNFLQHIIREHKYPEPRAKTRAAIRKSAHNPTWEVVNRCHMQTSLSPQDEPCKFCGKTFPTWKKLTVHLAKHMERIALPVLHLIENAEFSTQDTQSDAAIKDYSSKETEDQYETKRGAQTWQHIPEPSPIHSETSTYGTHPSTVPAFGHQGLSIESTDLFEDAGIEEQEEKRKRDLEAKIQSAERLDRERTQVHEKAQERKLILQWLSPIDFTSHHTKYFRRYLPGSGKGFLDSPTYHTWHNTSGQTLFCQGAPGIGKSILTSAVVEDLERQYSKGTIVGIAYRYCDAPIGISSPENLIGNILRQLSEIHYPLPKALKDLWTEYQDVPHITIPDTKLYSLIPSIFALFDRVFIVVDALDVHNKIHRDQILLKLHDMQINYGANIFITSRSGEVVSGPLSGPILETPGQLLENSSSEDLSQPPSLLGDRLQDKYGNKSFDWAEACKSGMERLSDLQPGLGDLLKEILAHLVSKGPILLLSEIRTFDAFEEALTWSIDSSDNGIAKMIGAITPLIQVDVGNHFIEVRLSHDEVKEHLTKNYSRYFTGNSKYTERKGLDENDMSSLQDEESEIASVFSDGSVQSSLSSHGDIMPAMIHEWADVLWNDDGLSSLYQIGFAKVGSDRLQRNFRVFLKRYGKRLREEADSDIQVQVAQFVQQSARQTALQIGQRLKPDVGFSIREAEPEVSKRAQIDTWLQAQEKHATETSRLLIDWDGEDLSSESDEEPESAEEPSLQAFEEVKEFMTSAQAFTSLRDELRTWLKVDNKVKSNGDGDEDVHKAHKSDMREGIGDPEEQQAAQEDCPTEAETEAERDDSESFTLWSYLRLQVANTFSPPPSGFQRVSYICGCGELSYLDVRELSRGGIERFRRRLLKSAATVRNTAHASNAASGDPQPPPPAYVASRNIPTQPVKDIQDTHRLPELDQPADPEQDVYTKAYTETSQEQDLQFLLLCVNTRTSTSLIHVDVGSLTNDQYLFQEINQKYRMARESHEWRVPMLFPEWSRKMILAVSERLPRKNLLPGSVGIFATLGRALNSIRLHKVSSGDFVRFQLIPIGEECCPSWFKPRVFPPESEVKQRRYLYEPVPMDDVEIASIPLPELLRPVAHLDKFWLSLFPKKLCEELQRPAGSQKPVIGWGIRINESINWPIVLLGIVCLLTVTGIIVGVYSAFTSDDSSAFGLGAYLVALLTLYFTYQYFSWKDGS